MKISSLMCVYCYFQEKGAVPQAELIIALLGTPQQQVWHPLKYTQLTLSKPFA